VSAAGITREQFRGGTIQQKMTRGSVVVILTALVLATSAFVPYYVIAGRRSIARELDVQSRMIALNSTSALLFDDERAAAETLAALQADGNVLAASIYTSGGRLFASYDARPSDATAPPATIDTSVRDSIRFSGLTASARQTIVSRGRTVGYVRIVYSLRELLTEVARFLLITGAVLVVAVFVALLAAKRVQRDLAEPIAQLATAALTVSRKTDYSVRVPVNHAIGELGMLMDTFNAMLSQIQARDEELDASARRYQRLNEDLERRVAERTSELQVINRELEAFTYSVSHDLRAPLRRIDGFSGMLTEKYGTQLAGDGAHYLTRIREGTLQMGRLIDDLLNLARLGRKELTPRPTDLSAIVTRVIDGLGRESEGRTIRWKREPLPVVECDAALMEVVLTNLLSNAVKYTRPREEAVIEIGIQRNGGAPAFFVRDNGVGFNMKYAEKLFGAFQRLHRADEFEGTGVGLATVQRIIHKHNGRIWVDAELNKGATFYFSIGGIPA
jgi:signal transduction histidine kinase